MYDGSDTIVLCKECAYQDVLPIAWRPLPASLDADLSAVFGDSNVRVLQSCAAIEEHGQIEKAGRKRPARCRPPTNRSEGQSAPGSGWPNTGQQPAAATSDDDPLQRPRCHLARRHFRSQVPKEPSRFICATVCRGHCSSSGESRVCRRKGRSRLASCLRERPQRNCAEA
jgi:hypothetical protein